MFQFIHAADIHLDSPLRGLHRYEGAPVEQIRQITRRALENLVTRAIELKVAFLAIAGDLYDGDWKDFRTGLYFVGQMVRLREAGIPVYLVAGNHDAANKMTRRLPLPDNVRIFSSARPETVRLESCDVAVHGQSFAAQAVTDNLAAAYPHADPKMFNVGLLHTAAAGAEGHEPYAPCTVDDLRAKGYDYWALGHVHKQQALCHDPAVWFCGNLQGRHVREAGPKGCLLVTVDGHRVQVEPQWLDLMRWEHCRVDVTGAVTPDDVLERIRDRLAQLVLASDGRMLAVRVSAVGRTAAHRALVAQSQRWTNELRAVAIDVGGGDLWLEKTTIDTAPPDAERSPAHDGPAGGPVGELLERIDQWKTAANTVEAVRGELAELLEKLPPELSQGPDALDLDQPGRVDALLDEVRELLVDQLLAREDRP